MKIRTLQLAMVAVSLAGAISAPDMSRKCYNLSHNCIVFSC